MIPELNDQKWFKQFVKVKIDRISLLNIVVCIQVASKDPEMPERVKKTALRTAKIIALHLIDNGIILSDEVRRSWEEELNVPYQIDPDMIIPGLTDSEGRPWK